MTVYLGSAIDPPHMTADQATHATVRASFEHVDRGTVLNFLGANIEAETVRNAYLPAAADRLIAVQERYDAQNMFRINHRLTSQAGSSRS